VRPAELSVLSSSSVPRGTTSTLRSPPGPRRIQQRKYRIIFHKEPVESRPLLAPAACMSLCLYVCVYQPVCTDSSSFRTNHLGHLRKFVSVAGRGKRIFVFSKHPDRRSQPRSVVPRQCSRRCPWGFSRVVHEADPSPQIVPRLRKWNTVSIAPYPVMLLAVTLYFTHAGCDFRLQVVCVAYSGLRTYRIHLVKDNFTGKFDSGYY